MPCSGKLILHVKFFTQYPAWLEINRGATVTKSVNFRLLGIFKVPHISHFSTFDHSCHFIQISLRCKNTSSWTYIHIFLLKNVPDDAEFCRKYNFAMINCFSIFPQKNHNRWVQKQDTRHGAPMPLFVDYIYIYIYIEQE